MGVAQEQVKISRFQGERVTGLDISGAFDITIRQGEDTGVTLSIPSHYEDNLVFENWGGTVKVGLKAGLRNILKMKNLQLKSSVPPWKKFCLVGHVN